MIRKDAQGADSRQAPKTNGRTLNPALHGCETFDFGPGDLADLRCQLRGFPAFSVHAPLPTPLCYPGSPSTSYLLDPDPVKRSASFDMLRHTIELASQWGARYTVVHFGGLHSDGLSPSEVRTLADHAGAQLNEWATDCSMPLHLEYAAYNPSFATPRDLLDVVSHYPSLHICLDVGHLRVGAEILDIDEWAVAELLAPYARSIHLWTTRGREDVRRYHHVPVHPSLTPADGWIDIPRMIRLVSAHSPDCGVVFEPDDLYDPDPVWQAEGMAWVAELVELADAAPTRQGSPQQDQN